MNNSIGFTLFKQPKIAEGKPYSNSREVFEGLSSYVEADREMFLVLMLNTKNQLIHIETHAIGTVNAASVFPRDIFKAALYYSAPALIFVHNHPSGNPEPSVEDKEITKTLCQGAQILGFKVLDHIIIGKDRYYSFQDNGLIPLEIQ